MTSTVVTFIASLIAFVLGVIAANRIKTVAADVADQCNAYNEYLHCILLPTVANVATSTIKTVAAVATSTINLVTVCTAVVITRIALDVAADVYGMIEVFTSMIDGLVEMASYDLSEQTSTYSLNVAAGTSAYSSGEYLVRDNGQWRNVYLSAYARALIGTSADVIALQPATVLDAAGTTRVWTVSLA